MKNNNNNNSGGGNNSRRNKKGHNNNDNNGGGNVGGGNNDNTPRTNRKLSISTAAPSPPTQGLTASNIIVGCTDAPVITPVARAGA